MKEFVIIADTSCDLEESFCADEGIILIPCHITTADGGDYFAYPRWDGTSPEEFYSVIKRNPSCCKTAPPNIYEFEKVFEAAIAEGKDVLLMTISSGMSGAYNFSLIARENIRKRIPSADIRIIDTQRFAPAFGLMINEALRLQKSGLSLQETAAALENNKNRYHQAGWMDDLAYVAKKGRLTHAKAFFGTLAGIKPIGEFDSNGFTTVIGKVKGTRTALNVLLSYVEATAAAPEENIFFVAHSNRLKQAMEYKAMLEERFHPKAVYFGEVHASCGVNVGPGLVAAYYMGTPISEDLSEERKLIESFAEGE